MIRAGLPLKQALLTLQDQARSRLWQKIFKQVIADIENGRSLADGLKRFQRLFGGLFISLIEIGEASGSLDESLSHLASQLERTYDLRKKIQAAMIYPLMILIVSLVLGSGLVFLILPRLIPLFEGLRIDLPWSTRLIIAVAYFVKTSFWPLLVGLVLLFGGVPLISRLRPVRKFIHQAILRLPIARSLVQTINLAYFSRVLAVLLKGGIPLTQALRVTSQSTNNLVYQQHISGAAAFVEKGKTISDYFIGRPKIFSRTFIQLIKAAEGSGKLEETLFYLADFYEKESSRRLDDFSNILGPMLLLAIGLVVTLLALGIVTPIYQMTKGLTK